MKYASLCVKDSHNLGDTIQQIAVEQFLPRIDCYLDRDTELDQDPGTQTIIILNGWFKYKRGQVAFPPHSKIYPIFLGFHTNLRNCPELVSEQVLEYYKNWEPIGCRDPYTQNLLRVQGIKVRPEVFCFTLTFPKRTEEPTNGKILVSSNNQLLLDQLPELIRSECSYFSHQHAADLNLDEKKALAKNTLLKYRNAKLVITTYLHAALPCIAMGVPVVLFYPLYPTYIKPHKVKLSQAEDVRRFSLAAQFIPIYDLVNLKQGLVDWNPKPLDIEDLKAQYQEILQSEINHISEIN